MQCKHLVRDYCTYHHMICPFVLNNMSDRMIEHVCTARKKDNLK